MLPAGAVIAKIDSDSQFGQNQSYERYIKNRFSGKWIAVVVAVQHTTTVVGSVKSWPNG